MLSHYILYPPSPPLEFTPRNPFLRYMSLCGAASDGEECEGWLVPFGTVSQLASTRKKVKKARGRKETANNGSILTLNGSGRGSSAHARAEGFPLHLPPRSRKGDKAGANYKHTRPTFLVTAR